MKSVDSRILAVIACLLWSTAFLGVKTGLQYMPPLFFAGIRFTLAGVAVGLIFRRPGYLKQLRKHWRVMLLIGLFQTFGLYSLFYFSLNNMRASTGAILNGLGPLVTALMAHFFMPGDRLTSRKFLSMLLGVASVVLVSGSGMATRGSVDSGELMGILLMSASLLVSGTAVILVARSSDELDPFILNSVQLTFGGLLLLSAGILTGALPRSIPPVHFYFALIWLVGVTSGGFFNLVLPSENPKGTSIQYNCLEIS